MNVSTIMTPVSSIRFDGSWTLAEVMKFFTTTQLDYILVAKNHNSLTVLTREQVESYVARAKLSKQEQARTPISAVTKSVYEVNCPPQAGVREAFSKMEDNDLDFLPVRTGDTLVGVLSRKTLSTLIDCVYVEEPRLVARGG